jgi:hypothetical protein
MHDDYLTAVSNMLISCGGLDAGQTVLIVQDPPGVGYHDPRLNDVVTRVAKHLGFSTLHHTEASSQNPGPPEGRLAAEMQQADLTVFLARRGDQMRFSQSQTGQIALVCYAVDLAMLRSGFGTVPHAAMVALRNTIDRFLWRASHIHVACPLGTDYWGRVRTAHNKPSDTQTLRFPLSVHSPLLAAGFAGRIVQAGFLVGTGSRYYRPYACPLNKPIAINCKGHEILSFDGVADDVARAQAHYAAIAQMYGLQKRFLHSWHAGIHPGCQFDNPAGSNFERWSGSAFGNPRLMHMHSCGAYPPGEISLNLLDPTITVDGIALWDKGKLRPERLPEGPALLAAYPKLARALHAPARACGAVHDQLCFA